MSRKPLVVGIIIGLVIGLPIGYLLGVLPTRLQSTSNNYAGYKEVKVYESRFGVRYRQFGEYIYLFVYYPNTIHSENNVTYEGFLYVWRTDLIEGTFFPLGLNVSHDLIGITFVITELHIEYCILMVKVITS